MKCPVCDVNLVIADRAGVEIDYCPQCRGVWLDRGELDKIIDRSNIGPSQNSNSRPVQPSHEYDSRHDDDHRRDRDYDRRPERKKERGGFLGDIFDF